MNLVDLAVIALVAFTAFLGHRAGLVGGALGLAGAAVAIGALIALAPLGAEAMTDLDPLIRSVVVITAVALAIGLGESVGGAIAGWIRRRMGRGILDALDRIAGAVLGLVQGVVLVWLLGGLITAAPSPALAAEARRSVLLREVDQRLPSPLGVIAELSRTLESTVLPDVFLGPAPEPAAPVDGPAPAVADRIAADARASTVRVEAVACGRLLSGTGFAVGDHHFVTNAHVVAGAASTEVSLDGRFERFEATVVFFDPALDVAVLHVPALQLPVLSFAGGSPERGAPAVTLGHTGGGRLRTIPAAIGRRIPAIGLDIYGVDRVARDVIELHAAVAQGDSGGPLILDDGSVGGVVFSESRDDPGIGYALSAQAVQERAADAFRTTEEASTGPCAR